MANAKVSFPRGTMFHVVLQKDGAYGIEVSGPAIPTPYTVTTFHEKEEALNWIVSRQKEAAEN